MNYRRIATFTGWLWIITFVTSILARFFFYARSRAACPGSRVLAATRSLTSFQATAREQLSQQSRIGESDEPGPVICAA